MCLFLIRNEKRIYKKTNHFPADFDKHQIIWHDNQTLNHRKICGYVCATKSKKNPNPSVFNFLWSSVSVHECPRIKHEISKSRMELLEGQLKDRTTRTTELQLVIVSPPLSVPTTPPDPITWIKATTQHRLCNKRYFEVMLLSFVPTTEHEQRKNRTTPDKGDLRGAHNERRSIKKKNNNSPMITKHFYIFWCKDVYRQDLEVKGESSIRPLSSIQLSLYADDVLEL